MLEICFLEVRQGRLEQAGNGLQDTACKMAYMMPFCLDTVHGYFGKDNNARIRIHVCGTSKEVVQAPDFQPDTITVLAKSLHSSKNFLNLKQANFYIE